MSDIHSIEYLERVRARYRYDQNTGHLTNSPGFRNAGDRAGSRKNTDGYRLVNVFYSKRSEHRLIWLIVTGVWPADDIDHINGMRDDNRWGNLRLATQSQNNENLRTARVDNKAGFLGVNFDSRAKKNPYKARITLKGRPIHIGVYPTPEEAHAAYLAKKREIHAFATI